MDADIIIGIIIIILVIMACVILILTRRKAEPNDLLLQKLSDLSVLSAKVEGIAGAQENLRNSLNSFERTIQALETRVVETAGMSEKALLKDFSEAKSTLAGIKTELENRKQSEAEIKTSTQRIEAIIAGSNSRGRAGENILAQAFQNLPPEMIETNFKVNNRPVEYALKLIDGKRIPIDSKWPNPDLIEKINSETDPGKRTEILKQIEQGIAAKISEVKKYIDPSRTTPWGVAAIPDSMFYACPNAQLRAHQEKVVLMPYSLALVYLLSLYQYHLQFARAVDVEKLDAYLLNLEDCLEKLEGKLENSIARGVTMISNAYTDCMHLVGDMRGACGSLKTTRDPQITSEARLQGSTSAGNNEKNSENLE